MIDPQNIDYDALVCELAAVIHHALIIFDDWLCERFGLNRRARGKFDN